MISLNVFEAAIFQEEQRCYSAIAQRFHSDRPTRAVLAVQRARSCIGSYFT